MDIVTIIKEKINKKERMDFVYREHDGMIRFYSVTPYLISQSYFQGLTDKGTASFQILNVLAVQKQKFPPKITWRKITSKDSLIVLPGKPGALSFKKLSQEEKNYLMQAFFSRQVIIMEDFIFVGPF